MIHYVRFTTPPVQDFSRPQDFERFRPLHTTVDEPSRFSLV